MSKALKITALGRPNPDAVGPAAAPATGAGLGAVSGVPPSGSTPIATGGGATGGSAAWQALPGVGPQRDQPRGLILTDLGNVLAPGAGGAWDNLYVERPCVWFDEIANRYGMIYNGVGSGQPSQLGLAWANAPEGPWTKDAGNPLLGPSGSAPDKDNVTNGFLWIEGGTYYLFYGGVTNWGASGTYTICLATASNAHGPWTRRGEMVTPAMVGVSPLRPCVVKLGDTYYMWFDVAYGGGGRSIKMATAASPLGPWTVYGTYLIGLPGVGGDWTGGSGPSDPQVIAIGDELWMSISGVIAGDQNASLQSQHDGYATASIADISGGFYGNWTLGSQVPIWTAGGEASLFQLPATMYHFYTPNTGTRQINLAVSKLLGASGAGGLTVTDGVTTVSSVTEETVPLGGVTNLGGGDAGLKYVTPTYGGQETVHPVAASGSSLTINPSDGNVHAITLTANCTISLGSVGSGACGLSLFLTQGSGAPWTVTWPGGIVWEGGSAPTLSTGVGNTDAIALIYVGTTWYGFGPQAAGGGPSPSSSVTGPDAFGASPAVGSSAAYSRGDHDHGVHALGTATPLVESGAGSAGTATSPSHEDHVHPAAGGAGTVDSVTDGTTTVSNPSQIDFTSGATVSNLGGGVAGVAVTGGGGGPSDYASGPSSSGHIVIPDFAASAPGGVAGLVTWFDASKITGLADGNTIGTWRNRAPLVPGMDALAAGSPIYKTNIINGLPVVRFDGVCYFTLGTLGFMGPTASVFLVFKLSSIANAYTGILGASITTDHGGYFIKSNGTSAAYPQGSTSYDGTGSAAFGTTNWNYVSLIYDIAAYKTRRNGANDKASTAFTTWLAGNGDIGYFLGRQYVSGRVFSGDIAEVLIYARSLTATEYAAVESYVQSKYGL